MAFIQPAGESISADMVSMNGFANLVSVADRLDNLDERTASFAPVDEDYYLSFPYEDMTGYYDDPRGERADKLHQLVLARKDLGSGIMLDAARLIYLPNYNLMGGQSVLSIGGTQTPGKGNQRQTDIMRFGDSLLAVDCFVAIDTTEPESSGWHMRHNTELEDFIAELQQNGLNYPQTADGIAQIERFGGVLINGSVDSGVRSAQLIEKEVRSKAGQGGEDATTKAAEKFNRLMADIATRSAAALDISLPNSDQ